MEQRFGLPGYANMNTQLIGVGFERARSMKCIIAAGTCLLLTLGAASAQSSISGPHKSNQIGGPNPVHNLVAPPRPAAAPPPKAAVSSPPKNPTAAGSTGAAPLRRAH
jgi:hypothetical protein